jgi:site-specific DNA-methyltransferase (adenine-specific)/modification methylase
MWTDNITGDTQAFDPAPWLTYPQVILWGADHYYDHLPPQGSWLVWDKRVGSTSDDHPDCEMAWANWPGVSRLHRQKWRGIIREGEENVSHGGKLHPAQKPVALLQWCVSMTSGTILDPYMGSGTTGLACIRAGRPFVGIELDPHYFAVACQRLQAECAQGLLFPALG